MVVVGGQAIVGGPAAGADALDDAMADQQVENAVDRHPVDSAAAFEGVKDVTGRQWETVVAHDLQNAQAIVRGLDMG